jgi:hypothetical protein
MRGSSESSTRRGRGRARGVEIRCAVMGRPRVTCVRILERPDVNARRRIRCTVYDIWYTMYGIRSFRFPCEIRESPPRNDEPDNLGFPLCRQALQPRSNLCVLAQAARVVVFGSLSLVDILSFCVHDSAHHVRDPRRRVVLFAPLPNGNAAAFRLSAPHGLSRGADLADQANDGTW